MVAVIVPVIGTTPGRCAGRRGWRSETPRLAERERARSRESGADIRIDIRHPQRGMRVDAVPFRARGADRATSPRYGELGADLLRLRRDDQVMPERRTSRGLGREIQMALASHGGGRCTALEVGGEVAGGTFDRAFDRRHARHRHRRRRHPPHRLVEIYRAFQRQVEQGNRAPA